MEREILIGRAPRESLEEAEQIVRAAERQMADRSWFVAGSLEEFDRWMERGKGLLYLAREKGTGKCAAMFFVILPGMEPENLGYDIGMGNAGLERTALMDTIAVMPEFRGQRLQYRMMQRVERELKEMGYRHLMCTVHPDNRFSRDNVECQGYQKVMTKDKYGGYLRDIWLKEI